MHARWAAGGRPWPPGRLSTASRLRGLRRALQFSGPLAVLMLVAAGANWRHDTAAPERQATAHEQPLPPDGAAEPRGAAAAGLSSADATAAPERWAKAPLASAFDEATDLRAFALAAARRPAEGGAFYALRALAECRLRPAIDEAAGVAADAGSSHRRLQARAARNDRLARRCAAFVPDEIADAEVDRLLALGLRANDPLATRYMLWLQAVQDGTLPAVANALGAVLRQRDAALLELVAITGPDFLSGGATARENDESQVRVRNAAWRLLPCELGAGCATAPADDLCERSSRCSQERWRSARRADPPEAGSEMERVLDEVTRLKGAVLEGNGSAVLGLAAPR